MAENELRPMTIGEILDGTFRLYREHFVTFLLIALAAYLPFALLNSVFVAMVSADAPPAEGGFGSVGAAMLIGGVALFFISAFIIIPLCQGALVHKISAGYLGERLGAWESYRRALPRLPRLILANILAGIIIMIGFLLLIVPGVIFSLWFMLITAVVMLEDAGTTGSLRRSKELMGGNLGKGFLLALAVLLIVIIFAFLVGFVVELIPWPSTSIGVFFQVAAEAVILPVQVAPIILFYYDLRIRKEAFDLQQLAMDMETSGDSDSRDDLAPA